MVARPVRATATDVLTGLPTRHFFEERLTAAARRCDAKQSKLAVLFIDLDGFKPVNDTFGHACGDRVLEQVGVRLRSLTRGSDVAARVGGDEFLLLIPGISSIEAVTRIAKALIEILSRPYKVEDREIGISCSVGIAIYPDGCRASKLIARADAAMYAAKRAGGTRHAFFSPEMDSDAKQNFDMVRDLRRAIANNELELYFQPKIDARSGKVTAAEALLRWNHPKLGLVLPGQFVPLAERTGLIGPLGDWVIEAACRQARAWRDKGLRMRVAINLSAYQMRQDDIVDRIIESLKRHRIRPSLLTCEITESAAMEDTLATQETFRRLGELGTHLSIDDFGTGYSSLAYLRKLPAEELKIDRSFVQDLEHSPDARAVVDAVLKLAHALGLKVVAEGVENPRQHQILVELGCDELQGYLFAKPMSARALLLWAIGDRGEASVFRNSLFGETRQTSMLAARTVTVDREAA
jgi:diguanylate cyclase (GGDEF)-like protein